MTVARMPRAGAIISASALERETLSLLKRLLVAYGEEVAQQEGVPLLAAPRSYTRAGQLDKWVEEQLPAIVVVSPGTTGRWEMRDGCYSAVFGLLIGVYASASTQAATHDVVRLWCAAVRGCLVQSPSLGGLCSSLVLVNERYDERVAQDRRSFAVGSVAFEARLNDVVDANAGALEGTTPPDDEPWTQVLTTDVKVERLEEKTPTPHREEAA